MFNKIIVIGCPGAGKSTFARNLSKIFDLPLYYLDMIWHKKDRTNIDINEFDDKLKQIMTNDKWIIDGNYQRTLEMRIQECDTIFLLDMPLEVCLASVEKRIGTKREDMPWIEEEFDEEFKQFIIDFPKNQLPYIYQLLDKYQNKNIYIFHNRKEINEFIQKMENTICKQENY